MAEGGTQIVVYGASGFTGGLICDELERRGVSYAIAGRDRAKLAVLSARLRSGPVAHAVAADDDAGLRSLLAPYGVVIACAGPFSLHGEGVLAAAAETGTHYLDTTGEQPFIRKAIETYGPAAAESGAALVSGMGFDYAPGDMLAGLVADGMGPLEEMVLAYSVRGFGATRGTMLSAIEMMGGGDVEYRDGRLVEADRRVSRGTWEFPAPLGRTRMTRYPAGEQVMVPTHVEVRNVRTLLSASATLPQRLAPLAPAVFGAGQLISRTPLRRAVEAAIRRLPEGPDDSTRGRNRFTIQAVARAGSGRERTGTLDGSDIYGITARLIVHGALLAAEPGFGRSGGLAPAAAFDPAPFLDAMGEHGLEWSCEPVPA